MKPQTRPTEPVPLAFQLRLRRRIGLRLQLLAARLIGKTEAAPPPATDFAENMQQVMTLIQGYYFAPKTGVARNITEKFGYDGAFLRIFTENRGVAVHKWHHYLPLYDHYFSRWRGKPVRFLEIGVSKGGSLTMWRTYFGPDAVIFGIDIDPACAAFDGQSGQVRIGSQDDPAFLARVVAEMGGLDVVLDDGSHMMVHVEASLQALYPALSLGGCYMIEDLHAAYWPAFGGGLGRPANFLARLGRIFDDMHHWYHQGAINEPALADLVAGVHVHDSIVVFDKARVYPPSHTEIG